MVHKCSEDDIKEVQLAVKRAIYAEELKCDTCDKIYFSSGGLRKHRIVEHSGQAASSSSAVPSGQRPSVECPGCDKAFHTNMELAEHCEREHSDGLSEFALVKEKFDTWANFETWLAEKECETVSKLVKRGCTRKSSKGNIYMYICQHARGEGAEIDSEEVKQRYRKTRRVHKHCPCFAKVQIHSSGIVEVTACFGHYGHDVNSASLPLSVSDEIIVKSMLEAGVPPQTIVSKIRASRWDAKLDAQKQSRICYLTTRDVANVAARHGLVDGRSCEDDRASLRILVENHEDIAAVKLVETDDVSGDGFILAFVTANGKKYLQRHGHRGLVFDDTFNVSRYSFRLATLVVSDDGGNGFPCAHLLSFRMSAAEVRVLFELVEECVPDFDPKYVMTDDTYVFYNGFKAVFPLSKAMKLLCLFHIDQSLERKHKEHLKKCHVSTANRLFHSLVLETDAKKFESSFSAYMSWLMSISATEMLDHVESTYSGRRREWALCYRQNAPFNTSNHAESWHNKLKHILLRSKQNNRLDTVVFALLKHSHDRDLQLISACVRGGSDISARQKDNIRRHKRALTYYKDNQAVITQEQENCWKVPSKSRDAVAYEVTFEDKCDCNDEVNSHCERCSVCAFQVHCTCPDGYKSGVACLHAHAVATFVAEASSMLRPLRHRLDTGSTGSSRSISRNENTAPQPGTAASEQFTLEIECSDATDPPEEIQKQDKTKEQYQVNEGIQAQLSEIARTLLKSNSGDVLEQWNNILLDAMKKLPRETIERKAFARRQVMQTTGAGPKPAKIQPQYKSRSKLKAERKERKYIDDSDNEEEMQRILGIDRKKLQTCFICGKRDPKKDGKDKVSWATPCIRLYLLLN
ncbi:hypothetical protein Y032_0607g586 [Ancylostoma ceylanicum]|nr:hypothetical protein Y032_0607g586 [Ancylostoma ceylanicum]